VWFSPYLLALVLSPVLLQTSTPLSCRPPGDATLSALELEVLGQDQIAFDPAQRRYEAWLPATASTMTVRANSTDPAALVTYELTPANGSTETGDVGTGGGEVSFGLPPSGSLLKIWVEAPEGASRLYLIYMLVGCSDCDDGNECTSDGCDSASQVCVHSLEADDTSCWDPPDRDTGSVVLAQEDVLIGSGSTFELDFYRNPAYECGLTGNYTFLVIEPRDNPGGEAPLWVYLHGGGIGYYDDQGVYHASRTQTEDTWNHEESLADLRDFRLPIGGGQLLDNTRGRRLAEGYRLLIVSMCDHDLYGGLGTPYPNNPNPGAEVNGLEATMAAVEYTVANYPTTHVFAHGTSAGSNGVYFLSFSFADVGVSLTGAIMDSTFPTPRYFPLFDALVGVPGFTHSDPGFDINDASAKIGFFGNTDLGTHTEAQVNAGFTDVPLLVLGGDVDRACGGTLPPIAEAAAAGLNNCDWYYDGVRQAVAAQPNSPHQVSILDGVGHVPTHDEGAVANDIVDTFITDILSTNPPHPFAP